MDQGSADPFTDKLQLAALMARIVVRRQPAVVRLQRHYDHTYSAVANCAADHAAFAAEALPG